MRNKQERRLAKLILCASMCAGLGVGLCACGSQSNTGTSAASSAATSATSVVASQATSADKPSDPPDAKEGDGQGGDPGAGGQGGMGGDPGSGGPGSNGGSGGAGGPGGSTSVDTGSSAYTLADGEALTSGTYSSTNSDESAILADGVTASISNVTVTKLSGATSNSDASNFYGMNSAVHAINGASLTITNADIDATAEGATGVFAYDGAVINISDSTVDVTGGGAGGIQVAGGGELYASNLSVTSASKAAIRADRGGGTMVVDGGTYTSTGTSGCPAIYSTADITVKNATLQSTQSRGVIIEGNNSVTLENCDLTGNDQSSSSDALQSNVLIYQSASGDADEGQGDFYMTGGTMTCQSGAMFYVTNTQAYISLNGVTLNNSSDNSLLVMGSSRWGQDGANGGTCTFDATNQTLYGDVSVSSISTLSLNLSNSYFEGCINSSGQEGEVSVSLDSSSTWTLTADSYVTSFSGDTSRVNTNGHTLYVNGQAI